MEKGGNVRFIQIKGVETDESISFQSTYTILD